MNIVDTVAIILLASILVLFFVLAFVWRILEATLEKALTAFLLFMKRMITT